MHNTLVCLVNAGSQLQLLLLGQPLIVQILLSVNKFLRVDLSRIYLQEEVLAGHNLLLHCVPHPVL